MANQPQVMAEKTLGQLIADAIKGSKANHEAIRKAAIESLRFAAKHGRADYFHKLQMESSKADQDAIRLFVKNLADSKEFSGSYQNDSGKELRVFFVNWSASAKTWQVMSSKNTSDKDKLSAGQESREKVLNASLKDFESVPLGTKQGNGESNTALFDEKAFDKALHNLLKKGAKYQVDVNRLKRIASNIETAEFKLSEMELKEAQSSVQREINKTRKRLEELEAQAKQNDQAIANEQEENDEEQAQAA